MNRDGPEKGKSPPKYDEDMRTTPVSIQNIERTQREIKRLNKESWAIVDALRAQRSSLNKTDSIQKFISRLRLSSVLINDSEKGNFRNRFIAYFGIFIWMVLVVYLVWNRK